MLGGVDSEFDPEPRKGLAFIKNNKLIPGGDLVSIAGVIFHAVGFMGFDGGDGDVMCVVILVVAMSF